MSLPPRGMEQPSCTAVPVTGSDALEDKLANCPHSCTLVCSDGSIDVSAEIMSLVSKTLRQALTLAHLRDEKVLVAPKQAIPLEVDVDTARLVLALSYPVPDVHITQYTLEQLGRVLPVLGKYDFDLLRKDAEQRMAKELTCSGGSFDPSKPGYLLKGLLIAEHLNLKALEDSCLSLAALLSKQDYLQRFTSGVLDADLCRLSQPLMLRLLKAAAPCGFCSPMLTTTRRCSSAKPCLVDRSPEDKWCSSCHASQQCACCGYWYS